MRRRRCFWGGLLVLLSHSTPRLSGKCWRWQVLSPESIVCHHKTSPHNAFYEVVGRIALAWNMQLIKPMCFEFIKARQTTVFNKSMSLKKAEGMDIKIRRCLPRRSGERIDFGHKCGLTHLFGPEQQLLLCRRHLSQVPAPLTPPASLLAAVFLFSSVELPRVQCICVLRSPCRPPMMCWCENERVYIYICTFATMSRMSWGMLVSPNLYSARCLAAAFCVDVIALLSAIFRFWTAI